MSSRPLSATFSAWRILAGGHFCTDKQRVAGSKPGPILGLVILSARPVVHSLTVIADYIVSNYCALRRTKLASAIVHPCKHFLSFATFMCSKKYDWLCSPRHKNVYFYPSKFFAIIFFYPKARKLWQKEFRKKTR